MPRAFFRLDWTREQARTYRGLVLSEFTIVNVVAECLFEKA